jgi:predicted DNA-binding antitoxin AbrB/MazE fold protein
LVINERSNKKEASQTVIAVYESGVFRLSNRLEIPLQDGQWVRLTIEQLLPDDEMLELFANFYDGLTEEDIAEIEKIMLDRSNFFPERDWSWLDGEDEQQES